MSEPITEQALPGELQADIASLAEYRGELAKAAADDDAERVGFYDMLVDLTQERVTAGAQAAWAAIDAAAEIDPAFCDTGANIGGI